METETLHEAFGTNSSSPTAVFKYMWHYSASYTVEPIFMFLSQ